MGLFTRKFGGKVSETDLLGGMVHKFIYKEIWRESFRN